MKRQSRTFNCLYCSKQVTLTPHNTNWLKAKYCCHSCSRKHYMAQKFPPILLDCVICGTPFKVVQSRLDKSNPKCCSTKCMGIWQSKNRVPWNKRNKEMRKCLQCGKYFEVVENSANRNVKKYCCRVCYALSLKNKIPWNKGKQYERVCLTCGKTFLVPEDRKDAKYCSKLCAVSGQKGHPSWSKGLTKLTDPRVAKWSGKNHGNWSGGPAPRYYYAGTFKHLRPVIRKRDNYTCQECTQTETQLGYPLSVHHIDYNKSNNDLNNLISLCKSCHAQTNFKRSDWKSYFKEKVDESLTKS